MNTTFYDEETHQWIEESPAPSVADAGAAEPPNPPLDENKEQ